MKHAASPWVSDETVELSAALQALAFMGDLSMGQPVDHSGRVARLAVMLAANLGQDDSFCRDVLHVALLRWSGCTANATEVAETISDDVQGRAHMLALQTERIHVLVAPELLPAKFVESSSIHCEVSSMIAESLQLGPVVAASLDFIFERWDGSGGPAGRTGDEIPAAALIVAVSSELEIFHRVYGLEGALSLLTARAGTIHPPNLVQRVVAHGREWLQVLAHQEMRIGEIGQSTGGLASLGLLADVIDLKLPWLAGYSRDVAQLGATVASRLGLDDLSRAKICRAGLVHGLGRLAVPNSVWDKAGALSSAEWERVRLSPYWTSRAAQGIRALEPEVEIASHAYERLDGTGYFRSARQAGMPIEYRILPAVTAFLAMQARRPWRPARTRSEALAQMHDATRVGAFDPDVMQAMEGAMSASVHHIAARPAPPLLTDRERDVLRCISLGDSNKEAAANLGVSPATVRTHMESVFRKLNCHSRSAATLRASLLGLL